MPMGMKRGEGVPVPTFRFGNSTRPSRSAIQARRPPDRRNDIEARPTDDEATTSAADHKEGRTARAPARSTTTHHPADHPKAWHPARPIQRFCLPGIRRYLEPDRRRGRSDQRNLLTLEYKLASTENHQTYASIEIATKAPPISRKKKNLLAILYIYRL
jgi:hypothetical protein